MRADRREPNFLIRVSLFRSQRGPPINTGTTSTFPLGFPLLAPTLAKQRDAIRRLRAVTGH